MFVWRPLSHSLCLHWQQPTIASMQLLKGKNSEWQNAIKVMLLLLLMVTRRWCHWFAITLGIVASKCNTISQIPNDKLHIFFNEFMFFFKETIKFDILLHRHQSIRYGKKNMKKLNKYFIIEKKQKVIDLLSVSIWANTASDSILVIY